MERNKEMQFNRGGSFHFYGGKEKAGLVLIQAIPEK